MRTSLPTPLVTPFGEYFPPPVDLRDAIVKREWFRSQQWYCEMKDRDGPFIVLDAFSGDGEFSLELHRLFPGALVVAQDVIEPAIPKLQAEWIEVTSLAAEAWSAEGQQFDVIFANFPFAKREHHDRVRGLFPLLKDRGLLIGLTPAHDVRTIPQKAREFLTWAAEFGEWIDVLPEKYLPVPGVVPPAAILLRKNLGRRENFAQPVYGYRSHHACTIALSLENGPHLESIQAIRSAEELRRFADEAAVELLKAGVFVDLREDVLQDVFRAITLAGQAREGGE